MDFILNLLLFIVALGLLVSVHELGHFLSAKAFRVYVTEFALGFGPKIFSKKRKKGETVFSLRVIPLGGFCAMVGEVDGVSNAPDVPKDRYLTSKSKWKQGIIFGSGIFLNFVLALILFFIANIAFPQETLLGQNFSGQICLSIDVSEDGLFAASGIKTYDGLLLDIYPKDNVNYYVVDYQSEVVFKDDTTDDCAIIFDYDGYRSTLPLGDISPFFDFYTYTVEEDGERVINFGNANALSNIKSYILSPIFLKGNDIANSDELFAKDETTGEYITISDLAIQVDVETTTTLGCELYLHSYYLGTDAFAKTFVDFGDGFTLIGKTLGGLFIGQGWDNIGGPVAIFQQSSSVLSGLGFGKYIYLWGLISVNLGLFNLLPFPGLDGWSILVLIIEGISRKKIPDKVKGVVQTVGMILLFTLMAAILIKDIFI